jgi:tRNA(Ile)-lysidine synthase
VDTWLAKHSHSSAPPGTFLVSPREFNLIEDELVRFALIRRILRYVSPHPWGSVAAESHRKSKSLQKIDNALRHQVTPFGHISSFSAGSDVHWTPVRVNGTKIFLPETFKLKQISPDAPGEDMWIASRLPPKNGQKTIKHMNHDPHSSSPIDILWDNRFRIHLDPGAMTSSTHSKLSQLRVEASHRWHLPQIYLSTSSQERPLTLDRMVMSKVGDRWTWVVPSVPGLMIQWIRMMDAR